MKQAVVRLKDENKPIREIVKTLGVAKYVICYISRKEEGTGELSRAQRPGCGHRNGPEQSVPGGQSL